MKILVVEDEPLIADFIQRGLRGHGYSTVTVGDAEHAIALAVSGEGVDLVVLDVRLPDYDGYYVLRVLRERGAQMPVIVLTGRPDLRDAVVCLEAGADDYMTKPFRPEELVARVHALLRRSAVGGGALLQVGDVSLDLHTRRVTAKGRTIDLTSREFSLLETFLRHPDQVLTREQLLSRVWGYNFEPRTNVVNVYVSSLRKKVGAQTIETVRGAGYRLRR